MKRVAFVVLAFFLPCALAAQTHPAELIDSLKAQAQSAGEAQPPAPEASPTSAPQLALTPPPTAPAAEASPPSAHPSLATPPEREKKPSVATEPPKILYDSDKVRYPFGYGRPSLRCVPLIACEIELQEGELITGFAVGDSDRWILDKFESGASGHRRQHVVVKPTAWGVGTNLLIGTDRRVYSLDLVAPARDRTENKDFSYTHVAFYYPDDLLAERDEIAAREEAQRRQTVGTVRLDNLHLGYRIAGSARIPWRPLRVFDDGARTFIQFPPALRSTDVPALLAVSDDGKTTSVLNYRRSDDGLYYVVDGTFQRARLLVQSGRKRTDALDIFREN